MDTHEENSEPFKTPEPSNRPFSAADAVVGWFKRNTYWIVPTVISSVFSATALFVMWSDRQDRTTRDLQDAVINARLTSDLASKQEITSLRTDLGVRLSSLESSVQEGMKSNGMGIESLAKLVSVMGERVSEIEGRVTEISGHVKILIERGLRNSAQLSPEEFQQNLPYTASLLELSPRYSVELPPSTAAQLQRTLARIDVRSPGFWPVASRVINYQSRLTSSQKIPPQPKTRASVLIENNTISGAHIVLDGATVRRNTFVRCVIEWRGGRIGAVKDNVFVECVFVLSPSNPPADIEKLGKAILASNLVKVET